MIALIIWIFWLISLLSLCMFLSKRVLLTPQFGFIGCFIPQAVYAIFYVKAWDLDFSSNTILVLFGGTLLFLVVSIMLQGFNSSSRKASRSSKQIAEIVKKKININRWKLIVLVVFQITVIVLYASYIMQNVSGLTLIEKISVLNSTNKFGGVEATIKFPLILNLMYSFSTSSAYLLVYILLHGIIFKYKQHRMLLISSIMLSVLTYMLRGDRFPTIALLVATLVQAYFIFGRARNWENVLNYKFILRCILLAVVAISVFPIFGEFLGRNNNLSLGNYMAVYLSAQLKNLDIYIRRGTFGCDISNWQTLYSLINFIGRRFGISQWIYDFDQPFISLNGYNLGNVYTAFYWYLHDGGYVGVIIFIILFAVTSYFFFQRAAFGRQKQEINLNVILYSYLYYGIVFSFFSNRYFSALVSFDLVKMVLSWVLLRCFFTRIKLVWGTKSSESFSLEGNQNSE